MSDGNGARVAGRVVGLACCGVIVLLLRIASDGSFDRIDLNLRSPAWIAVTITGLGVTAAAAALAVSLVLWPRPRLLWPAFLFGSFIVPFAIVLVSVGHQSGTAVAALGLVIIAIAGYVLFLVRPPASGR